MDNAENNNNGSSNILYSSTTLQVLKKNAVYEKQESITVESAYIFPISYVLCWKNT